MRSSPKVVSAALPLCMVLFSFGSSALVEPKAEVAAATLAWGQAIGEGDPEKVLPFYSDDAVLWGTLSPTVRSDRAALRDYFVTAFKVQPRPQGRLRRSVDPCVRECGGQYRLLHVLLCQGWRDEELARALQLHLRQERRALADRRSPFLGHALNTEIAYQTFNW